MCAERHTVSTAVHCPEPRAHGCSGREPTARRTFPTAHRQPSGACSGALHGDLPCGAAVDVEVDGAEGASGV
eukprot:2055801-Prymnesium_polylepis.1